MHQGCGRRLIPFDWDARAMLEACMVLLTLSLQECAVLTVLANDIYQEPLDVLGGCVWLVRCGRAWCCWCGRIARSRLVATVAPHEVRINQPRHHRSPGLVPLLDALSMASSVVAFVSNATRTVDQQRSEDNLEQKLTQVQRSACKDACRRSSREEVARRMVGRHASRTCEHRRPTRPRAPSLQLPEPQR